MSEQFVNEVLAKLYLKFTAEELAAIKLAVILSLEDYEVQKKQKDLVPYQRALPECYGAFLIAKKIEGGSKNSLEAYKLQIERMFYMVNKDIQEITTNDIRAFLYHLQQKTGMTNSSLDTVRSILMSFFSWSTSEGYLDKNPMATIKPIKSTSKLIEPFNDTELEKLRLGCINIKEQLIVELLATTGCRVSELTHIQLSDIDWATGSVKIVGKGDKERDLYLNAKTTLLLSEYLEHRKVGEDVNSLILRDRYPHNRIEKQAIERIVKKIGDRVGVANVHPHRFRHTFATNMIKRNVPVPYVQRMMGHASVDTTMIYAKVEDNEVKSMHGKYMN